MKNLKHIILFLFIILSPSISHSITQTINTLPSAGSSFLSDVTSFMANEDANRFIRYLTPQIQTGGTASTSGTLAHTISAVTGFPNGYYTTQAATSHTYTASTDTFVYLRDNDDRILVIGAATITYDNYLVFAEKANGTSQPTTPTGFLPLLEAVTDGSAITTVNDLRSLFMPVAEGYQPSLGDVLQINASSEVTGSSVTDNLSANTIYAKHRIQIGVGTSAVSLFVTDYTPIAGDILVIDSEGNAITGYQSLHIKSILQIGTGDSAVSLFGTEAGGTSPYSNAYLQLTSNASGVTFADGPPRLNQFPNSDLGVWSRSGGVSPKKDSAVSGYISASGASITILTGGTFSKEDHIVIGFATDGTGGLDETETGTSIFEITTVTPDGGSDSFTLVVEGDAYVTAAVSAVTDIVLAMPGISSVTDWAIDGWAKTTTLDIWRAPISGTSKEGALYSMYVNKRTDATEALIYPFTNLEDDVQFVEFHRGQTESVGAYVISWSVSNVRLRMLDSDGISSSVYHSGGGKWEWLEASRSMSTGITRFQVYVSFDADSGDTAYVQELCLAKGSSIGGGNCTGPPGEIINLEVRVGISTTNAPLAADDKTINIEVDSRLKIPKNVRALYLIARIRSTAISDSEGIEFGPSSGETDDLVVIPSVVNIGVKGSGRVRTDENGDIYELISISGNTIDRHFVGITAIEIR